jgi:hypothetical protein
VQTSDERHDVKHDPRLDRLLEALPQVVRRSYEWLVRPRAKWVRLPLGCVLIVGGLFGFLPILGFWMVPIGALLIGHDVPPVRRATLCALGRVQSWWDVARKSK